MRRVVLLLTALAVGIAVLRRRQPRRFVEVEFDDGSSVRMEGDPEARDLLEDAEAILEAVA